MSFVTFHPPGYQTPILGYVDYISFIGKAPSGMYKVVSVGLSHGGTFVEWELSHE
jgi:hypothetical protein